MTRGLRSASDAGAAVVTATGKSRLIRQVKSRTEVRAGARAVELGGPSVYQGGPKFEVKHNSRCLQKSKLVDWGGAKHVDWGARPLWRRP